MNITILLTIGLLIVTSLLIVLFIKHQKLSTSFKNYNPNPLFGPGRYNYGRNDPSRIAKEMRSENIRHFFTFKWTWYWMTDKYRKERRKRKEVMKILVNSLDKRKRAKLLSDRKSNAEIEGSHVVIKTKGGNKKLRKDFKSSGTK